MLFMHQIPASNAVARSAGSIFYLPINDLTRSSALLRDVYLQIRTDTTGQACIATYSVFSPCDAVYPTAEKYQHTSILCANAMLP